MPIANEPHYWRIEMVDDFQANPSFDFNSFVSLYEHLVDPLTLPIGLRALELAGISQGSKIIDVGAGTGALALEAAKRGANVVATDIAPQMVARASERLKPFAGCEARVMSFDALDVDAASFDAAFSIVGVLDFPDGTRGLQELTRVTRPGGTVAVATWDREQTGAPQYLARDVFAEIFPDRQLWPDNFLPQWSKAAVATALQATGCQRVDMHEFEGVWTVKSPTDVMKETRAPISHFPGYQSLTDEEKDRFAQAFTAAVTRYAGADGVARIPTRAFVVIGRVPI